MEDLLILKYPNKAEDIRKNREAGHSDESIDSEYQRRWHINQYNGHSLPDIEQAYGVSRESKKRYASAVKNERKRVMSEAFEISPKDLEETTQMANNLGVNPWVFLGNRDVYKTQMAKLEEEKEWARPKGDGLPQQDIAKVSQGNRLPEFGDTYTNLDAWMYPLARFASQFERWGMGTLGLPGEVVEGALNVADKVGIKVSPEAKEMLGAWNSSLRETPNFGIASPWVAEKGAMRRQALAERWGMVGTIAADISDTIYDYSALYALMTTVGTILGGPVGGAIGAGSVMASTKLTPVLAKIMRTAKLQGTMGFLTTPGDLKDRLQAGAYRVAYNLTPYIANATGAVGMEAVFADYLLNTSLSSPAYYNAIKENGLNRDTVSSLVVQNTMDFLMAWGTRGDPAHVRRVAQDQHIARMALESNLPESTVRDIAELNAKVAEEMFWRNEPVEVKGEGVKEGEGVYSNFFDISEVNGKWFINRKDTIDSERNKGRPFETRGDAIKRADELAVDEQKNMQQRMTMNERVAEEQRIRSQTRNPNVDAIADVNTPVKDEPLPGDTLERVVYDTKKGQPIETNELSAIGVSGESKDVRGLHVGDADYWKDRLLKDYERDNGKTIVIRVHDGDRLVEDPQYVTDPDTGIKGDSSVLLTSRAKLEYGKDWVFKGENFIIPKEDTPLSKVLSAKKGNKKIKTKVDKDGLVKTTEGKGNTLDATQPETARAILEEVVKDPNVKGQDRERVMKALKDDTPYVDLETMDSLPILDAVSRLGGGRVKVNLPPVEDMPLTTLLRVRGDDGGVKKEVSKLIKEIGEGTGTRVAWEEKKAVQEILEKLDLKHRSKFTMEQRAIVEDIVKDDPEAVEFLNKIDLAGLGKTTLNDMTLRELRDLHAQVKELTLIGISKTDEREIAEKKELDGTVREVRREIIEGSKEGEKVRPDFVTSREDVQGRNVGIVEGFLAHSKTMNRVFDAMSGYKGFVNPSKFVDFMWGRVNKNEDTKLTHLNNRRNFVIDDMNVKGIKPQDLAGKVIVEGGGKTKEYLIGEMMGVYAHSLVPFQRRGLIDLNGFTNEHIDAVVAQLKALDKDYIGLTHTIIKDFKDNFARVNDANIRYMNVGLDEIENYTPIHWLFRESGSKGFVDDYKDSIDQQYKALNIMKKNYARHGFSNQRVDNYSENMRGAYDLNLFGVWGKAIAEQEHFTAHGGHVRDMHRLMDSKDDLGVSFKETIRNTWGKPYERMIEEYINRLANPSIYKAMSYVENGLQTMKHNIALAYLSYNVVTMMKQAPSIALYMGESGPVELFAAIAKATSGGFGEMLKNAERWDPQIKNRGIDQAYMELQKTLENRNDWKAKIGNKGMMGIKAIDKVVVTIGWNAVFNAYKAKGYTDAEAARIAQTVTLNTQPAAHAKDLASMYATGNPAINMLLMFTNQLNKIWGITTHDFKGYAKRGEYHKGFLQAIGMGMSAMMIYALSGHLPSDEEDPNFLKWMALAVGGQIGSAVPLVGREVVSAMDGYFGGELPLYKTATGMARGTKGVLQSAMGQKEWSRADAYKIWEAFALMKGLPYTGGKRVVEAVINQNPAELVGRKTPKKPKFKYSSTRTQW